MKLKQNGLIIFDNFGFKREWTKMTKKDDKYKSVLGTDKEDMGEENCFKIKTRKMGGNMRKLRHILNTQWAIMR